MKPRDKIRALTSLRFFAAFWVMLYHTMPRMDALGQVVAPVIDLGYTAVSLFFILSGFILAKVYPRMRGRDNVLRFLVARIARVYPMYLLSLLIDVPRLLLFRVAKLGIGTGLLLTGATFAFQGAALQAWVPSLGALNFPSWSISTEVFFYLTFPLVLPLAERVTRDRHRIMLLLLLIAANLALSLILHPSNATPTADRGLWHNPVLRLPEFLFGILLAPLAGVGTPVGLFRRPAGIWLLPVIIVLGVAASLGIGPLFGDPRTSETLLMPVFGVTILLMASTEDGLAKLISGRLLVLLGEASYALYLLHAPVVAMFWAAGLKPDHWWSPSYIAYVVTTVMASIAIHLWFEHPVRRYIMRQWDARTDGAKLQPADRPNAEAGVASTRKRA